MLDECRMSVNILGGKFELTGLPGSNYEHVCINSAVFGLAI